MSLASLKNVGLWDGGLWSRNSEDDWLKNGNVKGGGSGNLCFGDGRSRDKNWIDDRLGEGSLKKIRLAHFGSVMMFPEVAV